ncbi:MAG TPA: glycosyltransferase family 39 protein [Patescibacteria group bacterium]
MIDWIKKHRFEASALLIVLSVALFLRLYRIGDYMTFLGDEGRDVRIVRDIFLKGHMPAIGPQTSVGNMYLGPLYYYMMAPALFLANFNPVGPAIMIALLSVFTIWFTWYVARTWFGKTAAFLAALFFSLSPVSIIYSHSSWNPNPMPFFALLCIWGIYQVWQNHKFFWIPIVGFSFSAGLQMHYLGLLLAPTLFIFWLLTFLKIKDDKKAVSILWKNTFYAIGIFLVMLLPLVLFDIKHQGMNLKAFESFFSDRQTTINLNPARSDRFIPLLVQSTSDMMLARTTGLEVLTIVVTLILSVIVYLKSKSKGPLMLLYLWIIIGFLGLGVYKQHVYIHYLGFLYPAFYLLMGVILGFLLKQKFILKTASLLVIFYLIYLNLSQTPILTPPNRQLQRTQEVVDLVIKESAGQPFNFALIAKQNYDESYRYFLENKKANMYPGDQKITDQLFVVCEDGDSCKPEGSPQYQVAIFGVAKVVEQWQIDYIKIYKMVHYK